MRLVLDTETSGLRKDKLPVTDPSQPHMVQMGAALFDVRWNKVGLFVALIKPDGWSIEPEAEAHHKISEARCAKFGVPVEAALVAFQAFAANAMQVVGHNLEFDWNVILAELHRLGSDGLWLKKKAGGKICTMELSTGPCGFPGQFGGMRFPSLEEAHRRFLPAEPYTTRHEAEADLMATARVAQALEREGLFPAMSFRPPQIDASWRT